MTQLDGKLKISTGDVSRRNLVKGAAWAVPVLAVAVATPLAAASVANASVAWTDSQSALLELHLIDTATVVTALLLVTTPIEFTVQNGEGAIVDEPATLLITVGRPDGINIVLGTARGFGVYSYNGAVTSSASRTVEYGTIPIIGGSVGFPITTFTTSTTLSIASGGQAVVPVEFGLAGTSSLLAISALASFPVTLTVKIGDRTLPSVTTTINVPVGAGIL